MGKKRARQRLDSLSSGCDLNVVIPSSVSGVSDTSLNDLLQRLSLLKYGTVALSRTIYGKPQNPVKKKTDAIDVDDLSKKYGICVLKRCNVVIEESSHCVYYNGAPDSSSSSSVLQDFDIIALIARNASVFSAACSGATGVDMLVLDVSKGKLPFWLTKQDLKIAADRGVVFELWYGPGIVDAAKRKYLIQTAVAFCQLVRSIRPRLKFVISSGPRQNGEGTDMGGLALRSVSDLENVFYSVLKMDEAMARSAMRDSAHHAIHVGMMRKCGYTSGTVETLVQEKFKFRKSAINSYDEDRVLKLLPTAKSVEITQECQENKETSEQEIANKPRDDDGFITF